MNTMQRRRGIFPGSSFYSEPESRINDCFDVKGCFCKPPANVTENGDNFMLEIAAPGLSKENFEIKLDKKVLTIKSEYESPECENDENMIRKEFCFKGFERSFGLPDSINTENISASYENGILKIIVPKLEETKEKPARQINVS